LAGVARSAAARSVRRRAARGVHATAPVHPRPCRRPGRAGAFRGPILRAPDAGRPRLPRTAMARSCDPGEALSSRAASGNRIWALPTGPEGANRGLLFSWGARPQVSRPTSPPRGGRHGGRPNNAVVSRKVGGRLVVGSPLRIEKRFRNGTGTMVRTTPRWTGRSRPAIGDGLNATCSRACRPTVTRDRSEGRRGQRKRSPPIEPPCGWQRERWVCPDYRTQPPHLFLHIGQQGKPHSSHRGEAAVSRPQGRGWRRG
jgi:hypothetical protein